jgi:hypothetical protein
VTPADQPSTIGTGAHSPASFLAAAAALNAREDALREAQQEAPNPPAAGPGPERARYLGSLAVRSGQAAPT